MKIIFGNKTKDFNDFLYCSIYSTVKRGYSGQRGYSGHFLFYFYFELKDIFEQSKCPHPYSTNQKSSDFGLVAQPTFGSLFEDF
jgi:hypothetical protein